MILDRVLQPRNEVITTSAGLEQFLRGNGVGTWSGEKINVDNAFQLVTVYACVKIISEGIAKLPFFVLEREKSDPRFKKVATTGEAGDINELLHSDPNDIQTSFEFREMLTGHASLRGNGYAFVNRVRGKVQELIPLHPDKVEPILNPKTLELEYIVTLPDGSHEPHPDEDILHIRGFGSDGIKGLSPIELHRETLGESRAQQRHSANLWGNRAMPGGHLQTDVKLSDEAVDRLNKQMTERFGGANSGGTLVLEEGLKWHQVGLTSTDAEFMANRKFTRSEIAVIWGVKPHLVGDLDRAIQSNIEEQARSHVTDTLLPWIIRWEGTTRKRLLKPIGREFFAKLVVEGLLRGSTKERGEFYTKMVTIGAYTRNEVRVLEDLNPIDGLDEPLTPLNMGEGSNGSENTD